MTLDQKGQRLPASRTAEAPTGHASEQFICITIFLNNNCLSSFTKPCYKTLLQSSWPDFPQRKMCKTVLQRACGPFMQCIIIYSPSVALFDEGAEKNKSLKLASAWHVITLGGVKKSWSQLINAVLLPEVDNEYAFKCERTSKFIVQWFNRCARNYRRQQCVPKATYQHQKPETAYFPVLCDGSLRLGGMLQRH